MAYWYHVHILTNYFQWRWKAISWSFFRFWRHSADANQLLVSCMVSLIPLFVNFLRLSIAHFKTVDSKITIWFSVGRPNVVVITNEKTRTHGKRIVSPGSFRHFQCQTVDIYAKGPHGMPMRIHIRFSVFSETASLLCFPRSHQDTVQSNNLLVLWSKPQQSAASKCRDRVEYSFWCNITHGPCLGQ